MISASVPGKSCIAGGYAVVELGHRAVLVAVGHLITMRVMVTEHVGRITSDLYATRSLMWYQRLEDEVLEVEGQLDDYVVSTIRVVEQVVRRKGGPMRLFDSGVSSELDDDSGREPGLDSLPAMTVVTVWTAVGFYGPPLDDMAAYKLALLTSGAMQPIGSGGDVAASALIGQVGYTSPDRTWLRRERVRTNTGNGPSRLVARRWPLLEICRLPSPGLSLCVEWTGAPAPTLRLVAGIQAGAYKTDDAAYTTFLSSSENCLGTLVQALRENDTVEISRRIEENRRLLSGLSRASGITIETPQLRRLMEIAQEHGVVAKSFGAGGGDCGTALCPSETDAAALCVIWEKAGIRPLDLSVHFHPEVTP